ncbi:hypothetical protein C8R44DRAFT_723592 [Mycena epipterygia]|nr:hypothetical protein C8R44DRAFT_723592 [Mycena epipterygia]
MTPGCPFALHMVLNGYPALLCHLVLHPLFQVHLGRSESNSLSIVRRGAGVDVRKRAREEMMQASWSFLNCGSGVGGRLNVLTGSGASGDLACTTCRDVRGGASDEQKRGSAGRAKRRASYTRRTLYLLRVRLIRERGGREHRGLEWDSHSMRRAGGSVHHRCVEDIVNGIYRQVALHSETQDVDAHAHERNEPPQFTCGLQCSGAYDGSDHDSGGRRIDRVEYKVGIAGSRSRTGLYVCNAAPKGVGAGAKTACTLAVANLKCTWLQRWILYSTLRSLRWLHFQVRRMPVFDLNSGVHVFDAGLLDVILQKDKFKFTATYDMVQ